jgi:hypothetical protein
VSGGAHDPHAASADTCAQFLYAQIFKTHTGSNSPIHSRPAQKRKVQPRMKLFMSAPRSLSVSVRR